MTQKSEDLPEYEEFRYGHLFRQWQVKDVPKSGVPFQLFQKGVQIII